MDKYVFMVCYGGSPLVCLDLGESNYLRYPGYEILNMYAEKYAFDRKKLTGNWVDTINSTEFFATQ